MFSVIDITVNDNIAVLYPSSSPVVRHQDTECLNLDAFKQDLKK